MARSVLVSSKNKERLYPLGLADWMGSAMPWRLGPHLVDAVTYHRWVRCCWPHFWAYNLVAFLREGGNTQKWGSAG